MSKFKHSSIMFSLLMKGIQQPYSFSTLVSQIIFHICSLNNNTSNIVKCNNTHSNHTRPNILETITANSPQLQQSSMHVTLATYFTPNTSIETPINYFEKNPALVQPHTINLSNHEFTFTHST